MSRKLNSRYIRANLYGSVLTQKFSVIQKNTSQQDEDFQQDDDWEFVGQQHDIDDIVPGVLHRAAQEEVMLELREIEDNRQCLIDLEKDIKSVQPRVDKFYKFPHVNVLVSNHQLEVFLKFNWLFFSHAMKIAIWSKF
jgi:hypothetical protein